MIYINGVAQVGVGDMTKAVYDPDLDGLIALAQLVDAVCSETEAGVIASAKRLDEFAAPTAKVDINAQALDNAQKFTGNSLYSASDNLLKAKDTEQTTDSESYAKLVEIDVPAGLVSSEFRVTFEMRNKGNTPSKGKIYKNGSPWGVEHTNSSPYTTYQEFSEDLSGAVGGDTIELWCYSTHFNGAYTVYIKNFRVKGTFGGETTELAPAEPSPPSW